MYNQEEYIYKEFLKNYTNKDEAIVFYGIGPNTGNLLQQITDYNIIGLMDGKLKTGSKYGKPILDYEEVKKLNVKKIVIIARPAVIGMLYHRISNFASENSIFVGDIHGNDLSQKYKSKGNDIPYFDLSWDDLYQKVEKYQTVSFDIFDTLITRKTFQPKNIFEVVQVTIQTEYSELVIDGFVSLRMIAESNLYACGINPKIEEIYEEIQKLVRCTDEVKDLYMECEIETEFRFIKPRESMLKFYNSIKDNKEINLISDMYLPQNIIEKLLHQCGYFGYKNIYVSCEYGVSKNNGLFEKYIKEDSSRKNSIHIGDNESADIRSAEAVGLDTFLVMSEKELLENSSYSEIIDKSVTLLDEITLGLVCNKLFDDPFVLYGKKGKVEISDYKILTSVVVAPLIIYFSGWLINEIKQDRCDYILFPSRDAYVLQKICNKLQNQKNNKIPGIYFYASRKSLLRISSFDCLDLEKNTSTDYFGSSVQIFKDRFNLILNEPDSEELDRNYVKELIKKYEKELLEICQQDRVCYLRYIESLGLNEIEKIAFIDFVAAGSVQSGLQKIFEKDTLQGYYFLKRNTNDEALEKQIKVKSYYQARGDYEIEANVYKYYLFLEMILTSPEPTFDGMSEELKPIFIDESRTMEHIKLVMNMQEEIMNLAEEIAELHPDVLNEKFSYVFPDVLVGFLGKEYTTILEEKVTSLVLTDEYISQTFNIFDRC